jgi:hypothetical protein
MILLSSIKKHVNNILISLDFLKSQFEIKPRADKKLGTVAGGLLTVIFIGFLMMYYISHYFYEIASKKSVYVNQ